MKNPEIEKLLDDLIIGPGPTPSIRELARRHGYHQNQFMRDYRKKVDVLIKKRTSEEKPKKKKPEPKRWQLSSECLKCGEDFASNGVFNRICTTCKNKEDWE